MGRPPILSIKPPPTLFFYLAVFLVVLGNMVFYSILGEVNGKRSQTEKISMLFVNHRLFEVVRIHRELFPSSRKRLAMFTLLALGIALGFAVFLLNPAF